MTIFSILLYYGVLIPLSLLPFRILYAVSDLLHLVLYRLAGYRKKVVMRNLRNAFPEKNEREIVRLASLFYRHLCDLVVESVKIFSISPGQVHARMKCRNPEVLDKLHDDGRSVILAGGHFNNWELFAVAVDELVKHRTIGIYTPLTNRFLDGKMQRSRSRYGLTMIATRKVKEFFREHTAERTMTIFAIDQSPSSASRCYWTTFLNQETAVLFGTEKYAREYNYPVVFGRILKLKRGYYEFEFELAVEDPSSMKPGEITEKVTRMLEKDIVGAPEYWLWSHRRWKRKREISEQ